MQKTVLIVDDSNTMRRMVASVMVDAGFVVVEGADGEQALARVAATSAIDLVITDLNMPVMDGLQLTKALRAMPAHKFTPILLLTTEASPERKQEGRTAGATGWLVKPFDPVQLMAVVKKVVS